jgi:predicted enzyme related to lactoylglutathione lyase
MEGATFTNTNLAGARFEDVNLQASRFTNVNLAGARFEDVNWQGPTFTNASLAGARFDDVNLQGATIANANLAGARFRDVNLTGARIDDANLTGMCINGAFVTDLIRDFGRRARMVLYAKDLARMQAFYQGVCRLEIEHLEPDHVVLGSSTSQLVLVQVPASIASTIHIADPPIRRTQTAVKLVFDVESIATARGAVLQLGGEMDPTESEWIFQACRVCDGHDPEGNVVQFQDRPHACGTRTDSAG